MLGLGVTFRGARDKLLPALEESPGLAEVTWEFSFALYSHANRFPGTLSARPSAVPLSACFPISVFLFSFSFLFLINACSRPAS